jgi:5-methylcytosine-specific restriction endonuclease McrA
MKTNIEFASPEAKLNAHPTLVLNADFKPESILPLSTRHWHDVAKNVVENTVIVVHEYSDVEVHSPSVSFPLPSVIALREFVVRRTRPELTRTTLIVLRDRCGCAYCGGKFHTHDLTIDHVIPKTVCRRLGVPAHRWENVVSACRTCNQQKADRTPEEAKMPLLWRPYLPSMEDLARAEFFINERKLHEGWRQYLTFLDAA